MELCELRRSLRDNSGAKRAFGVNPCLFSSRPHFSTVPTGPRKAGRGGATSWSIVNYDKAVKRAKLFLEHKEQAASRFYIKREY